MNILRIGILLVTLLSLVACSQTDKAISEFVDSIIKPQDKTLDCDCDEIHEAEIKDARANFKKLYPTPQNLGLIKELWAEADVEFRNSMTTGFTAKVYINDNKNNVANGSDVYIKENNIVHIREYRGQSQSFTYNQKICVNHINHIESLSDIDNYTVEYLPNSENDIDWVCHDDEDGVYSGIFEFDFDKIIRSTVENISVKGSNLREISLLAADDFAYSPFEYSREIKLIIGHNDVRPRSLKTKIKYDRFNVEYAQWDYDYSVPVKFVELPKDRIKNE